MKINKFLIFSILVTLTIGCKANTQDENLIMDFKREKYTDEQIDFLDKKYFESYELVIDESNINNHPFFRYLDCSKEGYFCVHFVPKEPDLRLFWEKQYYKNTDFNTYDFEKDSKRIDEIINKEKSKYNIFSYLIKKEYLNSTTGCTRKVFFQMIIV